MAASGADLGAEEALPDELPDLGEITPITPGEGTEGHAAA
jgi:hypothetical protein